MENPPVNLRPIVSFLLMGAQPKRPFHRFQDEVLREFFFEYVRALCAADLEMMIDDQCAEHLATRCMLGGAPSTAAKAHPNLTRADVTPLLRVSHVIHYYKKLDEWLDVLEALAARRTRVLIVTGFAMTVTRQIPNLSRIHPRHNLRGLRFRVLAAPLYPNWSTPLWQNPWRRALWRDNFVENLAVLKRSREWDPSRNEVALLGCGLYGLPLAYRAKQSGISSAYIGGLIAPLFGIHGKRHRADARINSSINAHWRVPLPEETPNRAVTARGDPDRVPGGAYW